MKLYVWFEDLDNGAWHGDGSAVVLAESLDQARALLVRWQEEGRRLYDWATPAKTQEPATVVDLGDSQAGPQVVACMTGCDC